MLNRSFKPAKCKTALKLAASRIKLLKNKRDAQVKQLKRELAQLLDSGQDQTARIRVEHVVREEKTMAAYDLIEIYCELIVARLPIIESQKTCPIDLKEAIASVIFASPRCADVPELMDVRKHFTAKYGKEFVSAAVELRPDCGVSRLMVEKLSAKAPDGPTKLKILTTIAEEHNIKWDPNTFGDKEMKPPEDLLNGPNTFEQASRIQSQEQPNYHGKGPISSGAEPKFYEKNDAPADAPDSRPSSHSQTFASTANNPNKAMPTATSHPNSRPSGSGSESMEFRHTYATEHSHSYAGRQGRHMEFKDATAAAQAAAESAELASLAARAAAELSSQGRISRQHSSESNRSSPMSKVDGLQNNSNSILKGENLGHAPASNTSCRSDSGMHVEQIFENEQDDLVGLAERFYNLKSSYKSSRLASSKSNSGSMDDLAQASDHHMADRHSRNASYEIDKNSLLGEATIKRESSDAEFANKMLNELTSENVGYYEEGSNREQSSSFFPRPHSRSPSDNHTVVSSFSKQKFAEAAVKEPCAVDDDKFQIDNDDKTSYDNHAALFDNSGSDDDESKFEVNDQYNPRDSSCYFSAGRKSSSHLLTSTSVKSPRLSMQVSLVKSSSQSPFAPESHSASVFSESWISDAPSKTDDLLPVTFDDSDGPGSESEGELDASKLVAVKDYGTSPRGNLIDPSNPEKSPNVNIKQTGSSLANKESTRSVRKTEKQQSRVGSDVEEYPEGVGRFEETEIDTNVGHSFLYGNQTSEGLVKSQSNSSHSGRLLSSVKKDTQKYQSSYNLGISESIEDSSLEYGQELKFGTLTGGLRNKGYRHPPYRRNASNGSSSSKQAEEENSTRPELLSSFHEIDTGLRAHDQEPSDELKHQVNNKSVSKVSVPSSDSSDHEFHEEFPLQNFPIHQEVDIPKLGSERRKRSGLRGYFDSDKSDSEEELPEEGITRRTRLGPGLSRRTKTPVSSSEQNSSLKSQQKSSIVSSYPTETQIKPSSQTKNSYYEQAFERQKSPEKISSKPVLSRQSTDTQHDHSPRFSRSDYWCGYEQQEGAEPSKSIQGSKRSPREENLKSSIKEQPSSPRFASASGAESTQSKRTSREESFKSSIKEQPSSPRFGSASGAESTKSKRSSRAESLKSLAKEQPSSPRFVSSGGAENIQFKRSSRNVNENLKLSVKEQPSSPSKTAASGGGESRKTSSSCADPPSRENIDKANHVHPKLPDYDTLTAHLLSLRENRK